MRNKELDEELDIELEKELEKIDDAAIRVMLVRLSYELLIAELIKQHPNPQVAFNTIIKKFPSAKQRICDLADLLELDLS